MKIEEMMDVEAWAKLRKIMQSASVKPAAKHKRKDATQHKLTDFERNTNRLRSAVARLKTKPPIKPVSMRT